MAQFAGLHRRQDDQVSYSDGDYYSTASYSDGGYYSTASYYAPSSSLQPTTATSDTPVSATATASTSSETISSSPRPTTTGSASTNTALSSSSSDLSTGAKAGIGVTIPLVVIILALSLLCYFRKRRANRRNGAGNNIPEISQQPWPENHSPESKNLPAEADSTALHEPDSNLVFKSPPVAAGTQNPSVYELSGNSAVEYPPAAALATQKHRTSLGHHSAKTYSSVSNDVFREAVTSSASTPASEMIPSRGLDGSTSALTDSRAPSQNPQVNTWEDTERPSSGVENSDAQLAQLEAEMARIAEERERLQQMQVLAGREAELKRQIAARKAANSGAKPDSSP
ncbi:hypothetical protein N7448_010023 [Penicillium atrosanguineum]|nr:hypothetical protein N7448_010023 [Penicillium atrosanguineum]